MNIEDYLTKDHLLQTKTILAAGFSKYELYSFIAKNHYQKIAHGIYALSDSFIDEALLLYQSHSDIVFSHEEALYYHNLIDREPIQRTITTYTGYNTKKFLKNGIKTYTVKRDLLDVGKIIVQNNFSNEIPIYNLERTMCDLFRSRSQIEFQDFQTALKSYVTRKDKNLNLLMGYAKLFNVDRIIRKYLEILL